MGLNQAREVATNRSARTSARPSGRQFFEGRHLTGYQLDHGIPINHTIEPPILPLTISQWNRLRFGNTSTR
jgi:hypothetical protein